MDTGPATVWQTAYYANGPGLLVRYASNNPERVKRVIGRAWWDRASRTQRKAFGDRP